MRWLAFQNSGGDSRLIFSFWDPGVSCPGDDSSDRFPEARASLLLVQIALSTAGMFMECKGCPETLLRKQTEILERS